MPTTTTKITTITTNLQVAVGNDMCVDCYPQHLASQLLGGIRWELNVITMKTMGLLFLLLRVVAG